MKMVLPNSVAFCQTFVQYAPPAAPHATSTVRGHGFCEYSSNSTLPKQISIGRDDRKLLHHLVKQSELAAFTKCTAIAHARANRSNFIENQNHVMFVLLRPFVELVERVNRRRCAPCTCRLVVLVVCKTVSGGDIDRLNRATCDRHHRWVACAHKVPADCCRLAHAAHSRDCNDATAIVHGLDVVGAHKAGADDRGVHACLLLSV